MQNFSSISELLQAFKKVTIRSDTGLNQRLKSATDNNYEVETIKSEAKMNIRTSRHQQKEYKFIKDNKCYNCNKFGHHINQCRQPKREKRSCFTCREFERGKELFQERAKKKEIAYIENVVKEDDFQKNVTYQISNNNINYILYLNTLVDIGTPDDVFCILIESGDVSVYLDDILIVLETLEHQIKILKHVFRLLIQNKMELRLDKCEFLTTKIEYVDYLITKEGIQPTMNGVAAIQKFLIPRNIKDVQSFIGLSSYFRKFIEKFAFIAKPLYETIKPNFLFNLVLKN